MSPRRWSPLFALLLACAACSADDAADDGSEGADGTGGTGGETGAGDGDGDAGPTPPSSCTLRPPPIARASFEGGWSGALIATPGSVAVTGELSGGTGPYDATWAGAKNQFFESPQLATAPATWEAQFEYGSATGWPDQCPADAPICAKSDRLSFSFTDKHVDEQAWSALFAQASLCVDLNRSEGVCPLPVAIDELTATAAADDPATLEFQVSLTHPELDCAGLDPEADGLRYVWTIATGEAEPFVAEGPTAEVTFAEANVDGRFFLGEVEAICTKTYDAEGTPTPLELRASSQFFVDCQ